MEHKVAIVTGANGGMGRVITETIALNGYEVVMACRDVHKGEPIWQELCQKTGSPIVLLPLDLSSLNSINQFIQEIKTRYKAIDLIINNAGAMAKYPKNTSYQVEYTIGVNYLASYLITRSLLPMMPIGSRIVNVSSLMYKYGKISPQSLDPVNPKKFTRFKSYSDSKLALLLMGLDFSDTCLNSGITINTCEPGIVNTPILKMGNRLVDFLANILLRPFVRTPQKGASTTIYLALDEAVASISGGFFSNKKEVELKKKHVWDNERLLLRTLSEQFIKSRQIEL
jgi:NAD(P)-dependent dehydrogenase (short-subunit alcohol dehydrogenase family)